MNTATRFEKNNSFSMVNAPKLIPTLEITKIKRIPVVANTCLFSNSK
jgi:hypothetical protein